MNTLKKTIFLSNQNKNKSIGIITLEKRNNNIFGTLKVYQNYKDSNYILGIKNNDKIIKQNVNLQNNVYSFILNDKIDLDKNIGCVLLESTYNTFEPLLWGSQHSDSYKSSIINSLRESVNKLNINKKEPSPLNEKKEDSANNSYLNSTIEQMKIQLDDIEKQYFDTTKNSFNFQDEEVFHPFSNITEKDIYPISQIELDGENFDSNLSQKSEIAIASSASLFETDDSELEEIIDANLDKQKQQNNHHEFYNMIAEQLDELFDKYPKEVNLEKLIPNSQWVKIDTDFDNKYYVVGITLENKDIKYICYGVPGTFRNEPPREMAPYSQWLPTNPQTPETDGYWVMYQDADTGENIYLN